jgi:hypothetical protein
VVGWRSFPEIAFSPPPPPGPYRRTGSENSTFT